MAGGQAADGLPADDGPADAQGPAGQLARQVMAGRLAAAVAHDLANLLTAILGSADFLLQQSGPDTPARSEVRLIRACARRGAELARRLAAHGGPGAPVPAPLAVDAAVRGAAPLLRRALGPDRRLRLRLGAGVAAVLLDPVALDQILLNLATNAAAALPPGGIFALCTSAGPDDGVLIEAQDNGPGFDAAILPHLFSPYATTRRASGGTGLGLASVQAVVRAAGGAVAADNAPAGGGARIRIRLPRAALSAPDARSAAPPAGPPEGAPPEGAPPEGGASPEGASPEGAAPEYAVRRSVLLVDDEPSVLAMTARGLGQRGWHVVAHRSAEAALAQAAGTWPAGRPDAVITDASLPGLDGPALLLALEARWPGLPGVLVSGYADGVLPDRPGRTAFLAKPFTLDDLLRAVDSVIGDYTGC